MKKIYLLFIMIINITIVKAQNIYPALDGTFVEGISPVENSFEFDDGTYYSSILFEVIDGSDNLIDSYSDSSPIGTNYSFSSFDMGLLDPNSYIQVIDEGSNSIIETLYFDITAKPSWLVNGSVDNVSVSGNQVSFQGIYPIYNYPYTIDNSLIGIGDRSLDIIGDFVFEAMYDISTQYATVYSNKVQIGINILDQYPTFSDYIDFTDLCTLDQDLNIELSTNQSFSTDPISLNIPKISFPAGPITVKLDAGITMYSTLSGQIVIGQDGSDWGFIDNGVERTEIIGVLTGEGFIRGEISVLLGAASASADLRAKARLGAGFDYISIPSSEANPLFAGDIDIRGKICYETFWGLGPGDCIESESFYYGMFGDTSNLRYSSNTFDSIFNTQSITFRDTGTLVIPDFNPQPTFATRDDKLYAVWLEHSDNTGYLLLSKLNQSGSAFSGSKVVVENENSISNPKVGILPSGSAIITWSQSSYDANTIPIDADEEVKLQAQDVWFAIYDNDLDSIVYRGKLADDNSQRAEGEAKIAIGDDNDAMITWVSKDGETSDIWYTHLTETTSTWDITQPEMLVDLAGANYSVNVSYVDSAQAIAVWINDPDSDNETYDNSLVYAEWDGNSWSSEQLLADNDGSIDFKEISMSSNQGYVALSWISTNYESDNDFENRISMQVYDAFVGDWIQSSEFEDSDSLYYFQNPFISVSDNGIASICYQVIEMYPDSGFIDNGELYLYVKDLTDASDWTEITENDNDFLCDTNSFIWELTAGFSANDKYYVMTQEYNDNGIVTEADLNGNGIIFGDPELSMVLRGLQVNSDLTVSDIEEPAEVPSGINKLSQKENFKLLQNYPNPFNNFTTIEFYLQQSSDVSLEVYNITGTRISQLVNSHLSPGNYKTLFSSGDLPNGIYLCRLSIDGRTSSIKLVINK